MAYTQIPDRTTADTNSAADVNQLQDNIEAVKGGSAATAPSTTIEDLSDDKADKVSGAVSGNLAELDANGNLVDSGVAEGDKADKVIGATAGNLAELDANGNLVDSGVAPADKVDSIGGTTKGIYTKQESVNFAASDTTTVTHNLNIASYGVIALNNNFAAPEYIIGVGNLQQNSFDLMISSSKTGPYNIAYMILEQ